MPNVIPKVKPGKQYTVHKNRNLPSSYMSGHRYSASHELIANPHVTEPIMPNDTEISPKVKKSKRQQKKEVDEINFWYK